MFAEEDYALKCSSVKVVNDWPLLVIRSHVGLGRFWKHPRGSYQKPLAVSFIQIKP